MLRNKIAIECRNILKYKIESIIDQFVPMKNKENGLQRTSCQKKPTMWSVYKQRKEENDYTNYKEAFNAAMAEIRQSKRSYE